MGCIRTVLLAFALASMQGGDLVDRQRASVQAAMERSLAQQRESVGQQVRNASDQSVVGAGFFTLEWPKPAVEIEAVGMCDPLPVEEVNRLVAENAKRAGIQQNLLREVMRRESGFRPCAVSPKGAQGLMQLMPATAEDFRVSDPFDPDQNVAAGARYLRVLLDRYAGDLRRALSAYNAGPGRVDAAGGIPNIPETRSYVSTILRAVLLD
jgi:hypothetical protein